jgi:hypothetical protein
LLIARRAAGGFVRSISFHCQQEFPMSSISPPQPRVCSAALALLPALLLAACGDPLSLDNYNRLQVGQSYEQVKQIIGDPARCDEALGVRNCVWGDERRGISVSFVGGNALLLSANKLK